jgi:hypothetical protein
MATATGAFDVKMTPEMEDKGEGPALGRFALDKQFHGDLQAVSKGQMLTAMGEVKTSAGYVAIERVTGTLQGRSGSFALLHRGIMSSAGQELSVMVVPDSGSGQLKGLKGEMSIKVVEGKHTYELNYSLA